ncbi:MAG: hypothetical protein E7812_10480 [Phenylobacterium sp.]|nr:MAG: hypothetical protein E7812_10480 [Phenylobacterium sp.]
MGSTVRVIVLGATCAVLLARPAIAGPPYLTDDPQPTDEGHWEVYNFANGSHDRSGLDGEAGLDLNYGSAKDLQLTAVLPLAYDNQNGFSTKGLRAGSGVVELAAKYKIVHADDDGWRPDVSVFPRLFAPTDHRYGTGHVGLLLPVWAEKDVGPWQVFGGGGYQINPGADQRNFWQGGIALNRIVSKRLQLGAEVFGQSRDAVDGPGYAAVNFAATVKLVEHWSLLASAGPTWAQGGAHGQLFYLSLKADY